MDVAALVSAWESSLAQPVCRRAAACLEGTGEANAGNLDVGRRDANMLSLHRQLVGTVLDGEGICVRCGERMDIAIPIAQLDTQGATDGVFECDGWHIELRLPTVDDVTWSLGQRDCEQALFARCLVRAVQNDGEIAAIDVPEDIRTLCETRLDAMAPLANLSISLACPTCAHEDALPLDVCAFVLGCVGDWAERQLTDVAVLCRAYGWSEASVLAMSSWRRAFYLARMGDA